MILSILCANIRGSHSKFRWKNGTENILEHENPDICLFQETWKQDLTDTDLFKYCSNDFEIESNNSVELSKCYNSAGTGMSNLTSKESVQVISTDSHGPRILVSNLAYPKITLVNIYAPCRNSALSKYDTFHRDLIDTIKTILKTERNVIICGDFNTEPQDNSVVNTLVNDSDMFKLVSTDSFTHESGRNLDWAIVSSHLHEYTTIRQVVNSTSDHDSLMLEITAPNIFKICEINNVINDDHAPIRFPNIPIPNEKMEPHFCKNIADYINEHLKHDEIRPLLQNLDFTKRPYRYTSDLIDHYLETITNSIIFAGKRVKKCMTDNNRNPKYTAFWCADCTETTKLLKKLKSENKTEEYRQVKRKFAKKLKKLKQNYNDTIVSKLIASCSNNINSFYKMIKNMTRKADIVPPYQKYHQRLSKIFSNGQSYKQIHFKQEPFVPFRNKNIEEVLLKVNTGKSSYQNIKIEHYKLVPVQHIRNLMNLCFCYSHIPQELATATIKPLLKDPLKSHKDPANFRPISLVHCLSKVYELLIQNFLTSETSPNQYAYKEKSSTFDCYYDFKNKVTEIRQKYGQAVVCYIDLSQAFDSLPFQQIFTLFTNDPNVPNYVARSFKNYATRTRFIVAEGLEIFPTKGIKQGGVISPVLFCHCVDPFLRKNLTTSYGEEIAIYGYADDFVVVSNTVSNVQSALYEFEKFSKETGLTPNAKKTKVQYFNDHDTKFLPQLQLCGVDLELVRNFKYLGMNTDSRFSDDNHFKMILSKFRKAVMIYKKILFIKDINLLLKILRVYTLPKLYGLEFMSVENSEKHRMRYEYILAIALNISTSEISSMLQKPEFSDLILANRIKTANRRLKDRLIFRKVRNL